MTIEEAKAAFIIEIREYHEENGTVGLMPDDDGLFDIGHGYRVNADEVHELVMEAL